MYSPPNEEKSEQFFRTLKSKIYKYMASISKNVYTDNSDDTTDKYNNTYHRTINVKPDDVKPSIYKYIYIYIYIYRL